MPNDAPAVRIGVVGVGHLGRHHARLLGQNSRADLVGVVDTSEKARQAAAADYGVATFADYRELADRVEAVCVAVPTSAHREVAGFFLERGVDVLVEKPITADLAEGRELVALAEAGERILQVGHVERFNSALRAIASLNIEPRYIEAHRLGALTFRSMDVGVVLDLMIHDLDIVLALVGSPVRSVEAFGGALFTPAEDMASAIVKFENGAVAQLTASRVALKPIRRMRMFSKSAYASLDFTEARGTVIRKGEGWDFQKLDVESIDPGKIDDLWKFVFEGLLSVEHYKLDEGNPLADQLDAFLASVRDRSRPAVSGEDGVAAVELAERILQSIGEHPW
ncbi:MAG: Gfo/Idh/MocA family oxidoreductase [Planctomycetota bacterium]